jgi:outer membrane protein
VIWFFLADLAMADDVTLADALAAARQHPDVRAAQAAFDAAESAANQARAGLLPHVTATASWDVGTVRGGSAFDLGQSWFGQVALDQRLLDFGPTLAGWKAGRLGAAAAEEDERNAEINVALGVREAWFTAVADRALVDVGQEALANQERHLAQVQAFIDIGTRAPIDLATAKAARANAEVDLIRAQGAYEQAKAILAQAMGIDGALPGEVATEDYPAVQGEDQPTDALLEEAMKGRADVAALEDRVSAQEASVRAATGGYGPHLDLGASAGAIGPSLDALRPNVDLGVSLTAPLFEGGSQRAVAGQERATLVVLQAQADALRQQVRLAIEQARVAVVSGKAAVSAADEAVEAARQQLELAQGRYDAGVGNAVELADAQLGLRNAEAQRVQTAFALADARARLEAAVGRNPGW